MHRQLHQNMGLATSINRRWDANPDALNQSQTTSQLGIMMPWNHHTVRDASQPSFPKGPKGPWLMTGDGACLVWKPWKFDLSLAEGGYKKYISIKSIPSRLPKWWILHKKKSRSAIQVIEAWSWFGIQANPDPEVLRGRTCWSYPSGKLTYLRKIITFK